MNERTVIVSKKSGALMRILRLGIAMIAAGIMACILEPQEGGAALIMIGGLGAWLTISRKQLIY